MTAVFFVEEGQADGPALAPFLTALATGIGIITAIFTPWGVTIGAIFTFIILVCWFWPTISPDHDTLVERESR